MQILNLNKNIFIELAHFKNIIIYGPKYFD